MNLFRHWTPGNFREQAQNFCALARQRYQIELDFSPLSLGRLEEWLENDFAPGSADDNATLIVTLGCYLGEVVVRNLAGTWRADEEFFHSPAVIIEGKLQTRTFPLSRVWKRFEYGNEHSLVDYYESLLRTLGRLSSPPGGHA